MHSSHWSHGMIAVHVSSLSSRSLSYSISTDLSSSLSPPWITFSHPAGVSLSNPSPPESPSPTSEPDTYLTAIPPRLSLVHVTYPLNHPPNKPQPQSSNSSRFLLLLLMILSPGHLSYSSSVLPFSPRIHSLHPCASCEDCMPRWPSESRHNQMGLIVDPTYSEYQFTYWNKSFLLKYLQGQIKCVFFECTSVIFSPKLTFKGWIHTKINCVFNGLNLLGILSIFLEF